VTFGIISARREGKTKVDVYSTQVAETDVQNVAQHLRLVKTRRNNFAKCRLAK